MDYAIYIDVSVDTEPAVIKENDIRLVPMSYTIGDEQRTCTELESDEALHEFYDRLRNGADSGTSQITPTYYEETFAREIEAGRGILYISLSGGLSNTYSSSMVAISNLKEEYGEVHIETVDSLAATGGMGLLLERAIRNRDGGMSLEDNAKDLREHALEISHWFMVDDLMFLKRGGRVSAATAVVGTALNVKPVLKIDDNGKLVSVSKQRGRNKTIKHLVELYMSTRDENQRQDIMIVHGDCQEDADKLKALIEEANPKANVRIRMLSPIIGAHTGPGMLAVILWGNRNYM